MTKLSHDARSAVPLLLSSVFGRTALLESSGTRKTSGMRSSGNGE